MWLPLSVILGFAVMGYNTGEEAMTAGTLTKISLIRASSPRDGRESLLLGHVLISHGYLTHLAKV